MSKLFLDPVAYVHIQAEPGFAGLTCGQAGVGSGRAWRVLTDPWWDGPSILEAERE